MNQFFAILVPTPISAIVIGAGDRGQVYAGYAHHNPEDLKIVAVAEPNKQKRVQFAAIHTLDPEQCFNSWEDLLSKPKIADVAIIATPDDQHTKPAIKAMKLGYHVLLEKPMARNQEECQQLVTFAKKSNTILQICHVLRYTRFFSTIKDIIIKGEIGDIVTITLRENVSYFHYAHSFVRGNWHNRDQTSPMILAKSSHDLDILFWLVDAFPKLVSSFGRLTHFGPQNKPKYAPERCTDGCPVADTCLYYAPRIYVDIIPLVHITRRGGSFIERQIAKASLFAPSLKSFPPVNKVNKYSGWPISVITQDTSREGRIQALQNGPYGRCVYDIPDHDVVDHQVAIIEFENQVTATFTMHGHSSEEGRSIRIDGTKGTILGDFKLSGEKIELTNSLTNKKKIVYSSRAEKGHGGGDQRLMSSFVDAVRNNTTQVLTSGENALISHLMAFAIDQARLQSRVVNFLEEYTRSI